MRYFQLLVFLFISHICISQVVLTADGPGDTYELITSVLAPGQNPIEAPDCNHLEFGEHIDEIFDTELDKNVFRFFMHVDPDNDRCINFDRQRNEIKSYGPSPDNLLGIENERVVYKWKFKLPEGFQSSTSFTHIHQLKSVGGSLASIPMYTLTTRKSSPDRIELRYAVTNSQVTLRTAPLESFIGSWVEVEESITYATNGEYDIKITRISDGEVLLSHSETSIINWRPGGDFVRPKWGIYRSLNNSENLRDEEVLFADFSVEEFGFVSASNTISDDFDISFSNLIENTLFIEEVPAIVTSIQLFSIGGNKVLDTKLESGSTFTHDVSALPNGIYVLNFISEKGSFAKQIVVQK
jgi:hypothetical protein